MTRVSVCIATYNGSKYIRKQLDSILDQLDQDDEIIISDDSSTDNTLEIVNSYNDPRFRIFPNQKFRSPVFNFEHALKHSAGEFIFLSDQDDIWLDHKVSRSLNALKDHDLILSDCRIIDAEDQVIVPSFFEINGSRNGFLKNLGKNSYLGCCMAMRRDILKRVLPFPKDIPMHDWWIGMVAEMSFSVAFLNEPLMSYRRHGVNASPTGEGSNFQYTRRFQFRWNLLKRLFLLWLRK